MDKISVGIILKPQGIKGEVKLYSSIGSSIKKIKYLYLDGVRTAVVSVRTDCEFAYIKLSTVNDRSYAETLRNKELFADRREVCLDEGNFLVDDIVGAKVIFENGDTLGELVEVLKNKKCADVFTVKTQNGEVLFPFLNDLVITIDAERKEIIINAERFKETALTKDSEEV